MTQILNLDDLGDTVDKTITYKKVNHAFKPMTVEEFIDMVRTAEQAGKEAQDEDSMAAKFTIIRETIAKAFPTLAPELGTMPVASLLAIFEFMQRTAGNDLETAKTEYTKDAAGNDQPVETPTT